ncbi:hypothetical protein GJAV_G00099090 [Gymnothorax javanicus]|nr:hypothetical protein GJAV_G00099090 [Gymnothorax javanicus]
MPSQSADIRAELYSWHRLHEINETIGAPTTVVKPIQNSLTKTSSRILTKNVISSTRTIMDSSSSLYMCSPCCQLFASLEEVLSHQLTCHPDDPGEEPPDAAPPEAQTESIVLYQSAEPIPDLQLPHADPSQQTVLSNSIVASQRYLSLQTPSSQSQASPAQGTQRRPALSSAPLIRYQCGDCSSLFESLSQWQQHRKFGPCSRTVSEEGAGQADSGGVEGGVKVEEQLEQGEDERLTQSEGGIVDGVREGEAGMETVGGVKTGLWQKDCALNELAVCRDHSYFPCAGDKQEADEQAVGEGWTANGVANEGLSTEESRTAGNHLNSESQPAGLQNAQAADEGESEAAERSFLCVCCGSSFSSEPALVAHRRTQHGLEEALHHCPVCGKGFMNTTLFLYHRRQHREKEEACGAAARPGNEAGGTKMAVGPLHSSVTSIVTKWKSSSGSSLSQKSPSAAAAVEGEVQAVGVDSAAQATLEHLSPSAKVDAIGVEDSKRPPAPHTCLHCGRVFKRRCHLLTHVYSHTGKKRYSCETCDKAFSYKSNLARHRHTHDCAKPYSCERCGKSFTQSSTLKQHWLIHAKADALSQEADGKEVEFQLPHPCTDCSASFKTRTQLLIHRHVHTGQYPFSCSDCGQTFLRRKQLQLHSLQHQGKEPISCPHCSSQFVNQSVLDTHLQRCSGKAGRGRSRSAGHLECDICGHRCVTQEGLDLHRLSHSGQTPLRCPLPPCRRRFASSAALEEHILAHCRSAQDPDSQAPAPKPRPFHCEHCGKDFTTASSLSVHLRIHTGERPYQCTQCGKRFRQIPHLRDHERLHSGARPFSCSVCGKSFVLAARLAEHARTHSGEKPYTCPLCPRAFRSLSNLGKHRKTHGRGGTATREPQSEGEAAVRTILLVQTPTGALEGDAQASPAASQLLLLHPSVPMGEGQEGEMLPIVPHTFQVIVEETV